MTSRERAGWSFARILAVTAGIGAAAGLAMGTFIRRPQAETRPDELGDEKARPLMPAFGALNVGDPMAPDPASLAGIPPYPHVSPRRLMKQAGAQGVPMSVAWFSTQDSVQTVLEFYQRAFAAENRQPVTHLLSDDVGYVAWLETYPDAGLGGGLMHMVSVMNQFGQTMVLLSASRPDLALAAVPPLPDGLSLPPSSTEPQVVHLGEDQLANEVVYVRVLNTSQTEVRTFFERQVKERGYQVALGAPRGSSQSSLVATKAGQTVSVAIKQEGEHASVVLTYERRSPQETPL